MKILARGTKSQVEELEIKLSSIDYSLVRFDDNNFPSANLEDFDIIFDFNFDEFPHQLKYYAGLNKKTIFVSAIKQQLAKAQHDYGQKIDCYLFGMNGLPSFINRSLFEVSLLNDTDKGILNECMEKLNWKYTLVEDRVGMVTPRVIFMIINEACYTLQEGTANMKDIDTSMKLGTNYPFGPFEWSDKIGIKYVYETLEAMYMDTKEERYKICPLLKTKYLKGESFY
ncbi:MAG: 3-hydroxyacyl-CoA dehydrogenase family protein [Bacteroidota bacterium]|jgi:3-hydroxybutyryl-CoA dehydrogenase|nr:3-hydroxyacyl-CoA dehydrogenase family protein [Crocinitomicaceae bacterium]